VTVEPAPSPRMPPGPAEPAGTKVAWVTGASRGIGQACAERLAAAGANVLLLARDAVALAHTAEKIEALGTEVEVVVGSVTADGCAEEALARALERWGRLDVLVNSAGTSPVVSRSEKLRQADWDTILDTNLAGSFRTSQVAGGHMIAQGGGSIVNISSVHGELAAPGLLAYAASKGGMNVMTRTLAVEWAEHGVRVNAVAPGYIGTSMTEGLRNSPKHSARLLARIPMGRFGLATEVAEVVSFLASDAAAYVTGSVLHVDGGWSAQ
jgi:NAD(P)-dependent dehydrogenase (short-subunit alcohol dehydrogenase family)